MSPATMICNLNAVFYLQTSLLKSWPFVTIISYSQKKSPSHYFFFGLAGNSRVNTHTSTKTYFSNTESYLYYKTIILLKSQHLSSSM